MTSEVVDHPRLLVFAYACEPRKGSEQAAGWMGVRMAAQLGDVRVITRENNREVIEAALPDLRERGSLHFEYVDLPSWARIWKRGKKGARLYYLLWQAAALHRARQLSRTRRFDLVWHLTWGNAWLGSSAPLMPQPFIYGPVGGGTGTPWRLFRVLGWRGTLFEGARTVARFVARYGNPLARFAWRRAELILVQNPETMAWLPKQHRSKSVIFHHAIVESRERPPTAIVPSSERSHAPTALFAGRLVPWKGVALAIEALTLLPGWRLLICGTGPDESRLMRLSRELGVDDRATFLGWVGRERLQEIMSVDADVFCFPSLHDDAPFAVAEALTARLPVVCLDRGGPPILGGTAVPSSSRPRTIRLLAEEMARAVGTVPPVFPGLSERASELHSILVERLSETLRWKDPHGASPPQAR